MKMRITYFLLGLLVFLSSCQPNYVGSLFSEMKKNDNYMGVTVPKWLLRSVDKKFVVKHAGASDALKSLKSIEGLRAVINLDKSKINVAKINDIMSKLSNSKSYDEIVKIKSKGNDIHVFVREKRDRVKQIVFVTELEKEYAILEIKTDININDINFDKIIKATEEATEKLDKNKKG